MNQVVLTGRLSKEPELFYSKEGIGVTSFHLAVKRNYKNASGEYEADFIPCVSFRKLAETIATYCDKGSLVALSGRLQTRSYENKDRVRSYVTEVVVESIEFLQRKKRTETPIPEPPPPAQHHEQLHVVPHNGATQQVTANSQNDATQQVSVTPQNIVSQQAQVMHKS